MRRDYSEDDDADVYKVSYCEQNMGKKIEELEGTSRNGRSNFIWKY